MEIVIRINTLDPTSPEQMRADAAFLLHVADNHAQFFAAAPGNPASIFGGARTPEPVAAVIPPAPPAPTSNGDGSATDLLRDKAPTPPAPPAIPTAPPAPAAPVAQAVELDKNNLPWDARIHASTKTKTKPGEWKRLKGVSDELVASVTAELRGQAAPAAPAAQTPPPPPPPAAPAATTPPPPPGAPAAAPAAPPAPPAAPAGADASAQQSAIIQAVTSGKLQMADVTAACMNIGFGNMGEVKQAGHMGLLYSALADKLA